MSKDDLATTVDAAPVATMPIRFEEVDSEECAEQLIQRWQNEALAGEIGRVLQLDHGVVSYIAHIIRSHREHWSRP